MINIAKAAMGLVGKQKNPNKDTAIGNVPPHSHDNSKNNNTMNPIGNITGNLNNNLKVQELGANLFQGEALAEQEMAKRNLGKPVMPPSPDPMGDQYGMQFNQPFAQTKHMAYPLPPQPKIKFVKPTREMTGLQREIPITKPTKKIYKERVEEVPKPREMTGLQREQRVHIREEKMEKPREMPRQGPLAQNGDPKTKKKGDYLSYSERNVEHSKGNFFQNANYPNKRTYFTISGDTSEIKETKGGQQYITNITGKNSPYVDEKRADTLWAGGKANISGAKFSQIDSGNQQSSSDKYGGMEANLQKYYPSSSKMKNIK